MKTQRQPVCIFLIILTLLWIVPIVQASDLSPLRGTDPLPSWNNTAAKKATIVFVERATREGTPDYVPPAERIATFENDGALWAEQPLYFPRIFAVDRLKALAYLRDKGFKTFIVSGGTTDFMRPWAEKAYGIPPERVAGSTLSTNF